MGVALAALVGGSAAAAVGVKPPLGIPDLAKMALRVSDLPAGAKVKRQGYVKTSSVAEYDREFASRTVRVGGKRLLSLRNDISLETSAFAAAFEFGQLRALLANKRFRQRIVDQFKKELGVLADFVRVSVPFRFGAGEESVGLTITIGTFLGTLQEELGFFRVDRVVSVLVFVGPPDVRLTHGDLAWLARPVNTHMIVELVPRSSVVPVVSGTATAGQALTASQGTWTNAPLSYAYQWQRCDTGGANCADIAGATSLSYVLLNDDAGSTVRVEVTARNAVGSTTAESAPTAVVAELAGPPLNIVAPTIAGVAAQGQTLTATAGTWVGGATGFGYEWRRCDTSGANCAAIDGATAPTYLAGASDAGSTLRVTVTATNASGSTQAVSAQTAIVG